jgi:hypothetical protein
LIKKDKSNMMHFMVPFTCGKYLSIGCSNKSMRQEKGKIKKHKQKMKTKWPNGRITLAIISMLYASDQSVVAKMRDGWACDFCLCYGILVLVLVRLLVLVISNEGRYGILRWRCPKYMHIHTLPNNKCLTINAG